MGRMLGALFSLFAAFCVATILVEAALAGFLWFHWKLDRPKLIAALAAAQGVDLHPQQEAAARSEEVRPEQPSYDDVLAARAIRVRHLELREQAIQSELGQLRFLDSQLAQEEQRFQKSQQDFEKRLANLLEGTKAEGRDEVGNMLTSIKAKQAKELVVEMLDNEEMDQVVLLLKAMPPSKRAKIIGEFKTPEEVEKVGEVLRRIREGDPVTDIAEQAANPNPPKDTP